MTPLEVLRGMRELLVKFDAAGDDDAVSAPEFSDMAMHMVDDFRELLDRADIPAASPPAIPPDSELVAIVDELDAAFGVGDEGKSFDVSMHEYWPRLSEALRERVKT